MSLCSAFRGTRRGTVDAGVPHCPNGHLLGWIGPRTSCDGAGCEYNIREV